MNEMAGVASTGQKKLSMGEKEREREGEREAKQINKELLIPRRICAGVSVLGSKQDHNCGLC